jgi:hypothetical protein
MAFLSAERLGKFNLLVKEFMRGYRTRNNHAGNTGVQALLDSVNSLREKIPQAAQPNVRKIKDAD